MVSFRGRHERQQSIYEIFPDAFTVSSVLNLGSDDDYFESLLNDNQDYYSIDKYNDPTVKCDLEANYIPFSDNSIDTVLCLDVLEHLDSFHSTFDDVLRVADKYVIITLPNNLHWFHRLAFLQGNTLSGKYGLPVEKPDDRHRWLMGYSEVDNCIRSRMSGTDWSIKDVVSPKYRFNRYSARFVNWITTFFNDNLSAWSYWCCLERG